MANVSGPPVICASHRPDNGLRSRQPGAGPPGAWSPAHTGDRDHRTLRPGGLGGGYVKVNWPVPAALHKGASYWAHG